MFMLDSGGVGDMQTIFTGLRGEQYFIQLDVGWFFNEMPIAGNDKFKTAFCNADGCSYELDRVGFGLTVLPTAFTTIVKGALSG